MNDEMNNVSDVDSESGTAEEQNEGRFGTFVSGLAGLFVLLVFLFVLACFSGYFIAGCSSKPKGVIAPQVIDGAAVLDRATIAQIEALAFPEDIPVLVRTIDRIGLDQIGSFATDKMPKEPHWKQVRPVNFLRRTFRRNKPWSTGVYVLVSMEPRLLQIRFGKHIRLRAYRGNIAAGPWYTAKQEFEKELLNEHLVQTLTELAQKFEELSRSSWVIRKLESLASIVWSDLEDFTMPSDNFLADAALKNYIWLISAVGGKGSLWRFILMSILCYLVLWVFLKKLLIDKVILPRVAKHAWKVGIQITSSVGLAAFIFTGLLSMVVLGRGRMEDQMALAYLGLSDLENFALNAAYFAERGGLLFALPGALVAFIKEMTEINRPDQGQSGVSFGFLAWGAALFLLPKAICIVVMFVLVSGMFSAVVAAARK